jgi:hypothetical protein
MKRTFDQAGVNDLQQFVLATPHADRLAMINFVMSDLAGFMLAYFDLRPSQIQYLNNMSTALKPSLALELPTAGTTDWPLTSKRTAVRSMKKKTHQRISSFHDTIHPVNYLLQTVCCRQVIFLSALFTGMRQEADPRFSETNVEYSPKSTATCKTASFKLVEAEMDFVSKSTLTKSFHQRLPGSRTRLLCNQQISIFEEYLETGNLASYCYLLEVSSPITIRFEICSPQTHLLYHLAGRASIHYSQPQVTPNLFSAPNMAHFFMPLRR